MPEAEKTYGPWKRTLITLFVLVHVYIIFAWGLPGSPFRSVLCHPVSQYVMYAGLWHSWEMFAPDPLAMNLTVEAEITYADGAKGIWEFPRMEKLGFWERFQKERYRKWRERVRQDAYNAIWTDVTRYIARLHYQPENPPREVVLIRRWQPIPPPMVDLDTNNLAASPMRDYQPMPKEFPMGFSYRFKHYLVQPEDLQ